MEKRKQKRKKSDLILMISFIFLIVFNLKSQDFKDLESKYFIKKNKHYSGNINDSIFNTFIYKTIQLNVVSSIDFFDETNQRKVNSKINLDFKNSLSIFYHDSSSNKYSLDYLIPIPGNIKLYFNLKIPQESFDMFVSYVDENYIILREYWKIYKKGSKTKYKRKLKRVVLYKWTYV